MRRPSAVAAAGSVVVAVLALDQVTKVLVRHHVERGEEDSILPGVTLVHTENKGVAFGALGGSAVAVAVVIGIAVAGLVLYFARHRSTPWIWLPTGLLVGGAVGNIFDRARSGSVTDFVKLPAWPAFNVADVAITCGVLALVLVLEQESDGADRGSG